MENRLLGKYFTRQPHDKYPAHSPCIAYRTPNNCLLLVFEDGNSIELMNGYAEGLEPRPNSSLVEILSFLAVKEMQEQEDAKLLDYLDKVSKSCQ